MWCLMLTFVGAGRTCTSSMYTLTYDQIMDEFGCSRIVATLGLSFFIWGLGLGPLVLAPLSEACCAFPLYNAPLTPCSFMAAGTYTSPLSHFS